MPSRLGQRETSVRWPTSLTQNWSACPSNFDKVHAKALSYGVAVNTQFEVDCEGRRYTTVLTDNSLEFCPLS